MKTLSDTADLLAQLSYNVTSAIYHNKDNPEYDSAKANENLEMLNLAFKTVMQKLEEEERSKGDRLDKLLDALEKDNGRSMRSIACVCVALNTMEHHLNAINEFHAAGRCNEIQHEYLG